jgi:curved DNA-binding protein CbpA
MAELDPNFDIEAQALAQIIEELDYFQILKVEQTATAEELKQAYFRESRLYHPDQFYAAADSEGKRAVFRIYKRINEAFVCLRDGRKRAKYQQDVNGPDRARKLRYTEASEEELKREREAELGVTPQGRKMFAAGVLELEACRYAQAAQNFKMALMYEPQNVLFKQKQEEAAKLASGRK